MWLIQRERKFWKYRAFHIVLRDYKHLQQEYQRTYLYGIVHSHRKTEKVVFFMTTKDVRCVLYRWHGTHRYDIQVLATHTRVNMGAFCSHGHPISANCLYHARMVLSVGRSFEYFARNGLCTVTTDLFLWYSNTQNDFSPVAAIFSLHTLASPSGRNVNYDEKQLTGKNIWVVPSICTGFVNTCLTGFPVINFCNTIVHYETPCIVHLTPMKTDSIKQVGTLLV